MNDRRENKRTNTPRILFSPSTKSFARVFVIPEIRKMRDYWLLLAVDGMKQTANSSEPSTTYTIECYCTRVKNKEDTTAVVAMIENSILSLSSSFSSLLQKRCMQHCGLRQRCRTPKLKCLLLPPFLWLAALGASRLVPLHTTL